ncbi:hypothetical protein [Duganella hordei]|uniref:hypothetical protein n=1 Tax=Duganella hordei TaxID=2865934 RepID=UPI00334021BE
MASQFKIIMTLRCAILAFGFLFSTAAASADSASSKLIDQMQGVYKHRFANAVYVGEGKPDEPYQSEDIVEIVRYDDERIYFRAELQFYNGHTCSISGIAKYDQGHFVYRDPQAPLPGEAPCTMSISTNAGQLSLTDRINGSASCHPGHCGARGSLSDYTIPTSAKRNIRYMDRLKASTEYKQAVDELSTK